MKKLAILLLFAAGLRADEEVTRVFQLKYVSPQAMASLLGAFGNMRISPVEQFKTLTIKSTAASLAEVEKVIQRKPSTARTAARGLSPASASTYTISPRSIFNNTSASTRWSRIATIPTRSPTGRCNSVGDAGGPR